MLTNVGDISLDLQKAILKECPINSRSHKTWLAYLDKVETKVRQSNLADNANRIMLKLYEDACSCLSELWDEEAYLIMFIRRTILALHEQSSLGLCLLSICSFNARRNPQVAIAVAFLYDAVGQKTRARNLIATAKKFADHNSLKHLSVADNLLAQDGDLKPLVGVFYYEPPYQSELKYLDSSLNQSGADTSFKKPFTPHAKTTNLFPSMLHSRNAQGSSSLAESLSGTGISSSRTDFINRSSHSDFTRVTPELRRYSTPPQAECPTAPSELIHSNQPEIARNVSGISSLDASNSAVDASTTPGKSNDCSSTMSVSSEDSHLCPSATVPPAPAPTISNPVSVEKVLHSRPAPTQPGSTRIPLQPLNFSYLKPTPVTQPDAVHSVRPRVTTDENNYEPTAVCDSSSFVLDSTKVHGSTEHPPEPAAAAAASPSDRDAAVDTPERITVNGQSYWILRELGRGGSSVVYSALDSKRCLWAIKCVELSRVDKQLIAGFANEISMLRSLGDTERVIRLHDYEHKSDRMYLVLEHANTDLKNIFLRLMKLASTEEAKPDMEPFIPLPAVIFYWDQMLRCVKVLHDRRIVHLDLKPQNFVLVDGLLKLIDLGISQRLPDDSTRINAAVPLGTLTFMSPEQLGGPETCAPQPGKLWSPEAVRETRFTLGRKSDIWSLGVMLYMMVYSRLPFPQTTVQSRMLAIINPDLPIEFPPITNQGLHKALRRCLVRDFHERASIDELLSLTYV